MTIETMQFVMGWIERHVLGSDLAIGKFLKQAAPGTRGASRKVVQHDVDDDPGHRDIEPDGRVQRAMARCRSYFAASPRRRVMTASTGTAAASTV